MAFGDYALQTAVIEYHKNEYRAESVVKILLADLRVDPNAADGSAGN